jgi:uncharacterized pyridoxamine 5'-phosphate oxidase family protein
LVELVNMNLTQKQSGFLKDNNVIFSTASLDGKPHSIVVEINKVEDNKIIFTDNLMRVTAKNLKENSRGVILSCNNDYSYCLRVSGSVEYHVDDEYHEFVKNLETNKNLLKKLLLF